MKKILLIEDDTDLFALLKYNLEKEGFAMAGSQTGKGALDLCRQVRPDLILLDIMLPDYDGLEICKAVRKDPDLLSTPIIFLTARASETDRIVGLELGANDYVVKPFFVRELIARIKLQFRNQTAPARVLDAGGVQLDRGSCQARLNGNLLNLTATEFRLLEFLMSRPGVVLPSRGGLQPRATVECRVGPGSRDYRPRRRRVCSSPAAEDRDRPDQSGPHPFGAGIRLHLRAARFERHFRRVKVAPNSAVSCTIVWNRRPCEIYWLS
jgi:two-component system, OmpR family, phosphate regulon response regulator PhoB